MPMTGLTFMFKTAKCFYLNRISEPHARSPSSCGVVSPGSAGCRPRKPGHLLSRASSPGEEAKRNRRAGQGRAVTVTRYVKPNHSPKALAACGRAVHSLCLTATPEEWDPRNDAQVSKMKGSSRSHLITRRAGREAVPSESASYLLHGPWSGGPLRNMDPSRQKTGGPFRHPGTVSRAGVCGAR